MKAKCPHCNKEINPASIMGKLSAKKSPKSNDFMKSMVKKRWKDHKAKKLDK